MSSRSSHVAACAGIPFQGCVKVREEGPHPPSILAQMGILVAFTSGL